MKITLLTTCDWGNEGDELEKPDAWVKHHARKIGEVFELVEDSVAKAGVKISDGGSIEKAYALLSDGDKDSIRKGFKKLVERKSGWILVDCTNKVMQEIHISAISREVEIKDAKNSAIVRAGEKLKRLAAMKGLLKAMVEDGDVLLEYSEVDKFDILKEIDELVFRG